MLKIFAVMLAAMAVGYIFRNRRIPRGWVSRAVSCAIMLLMMVVGIEMGGSEGLSEVLGSIIFDALLLTAAAVGGTLLFAMVVNRFILRMEVEERDDSEPRGALGYGFSIGVVAVFVLGVVVGYCDVLPFMPDRVSIVALYVLMGLVGFSIGSDTKALEALRGQPWRVIFVPMATIMGTLFGVLLISPLVELNIFDQLAVGSGFGYYSLSSVLLSELRGVELGALALMVNVMRELTTVICAPVFVRLFSPLSVVCSGGATTLDVTLPVVIGHCGRSFIGVALFQGVVVDLSVPFLVTFFASFSA